MATFRWSTGIEDTFVPQSGPGRRPLDEYELTQHDVKWKSDLALCVELGVDSIRYGIPWYRVQPEPRRFDWGWVDPVMEYLQKHEIDPIIDLVHYGTPLWMTDTFLHPDYPQFVSAYAHAFAERYRDAVYLYTPLNEPFIHAEFCGRLGRWPPCRTGEQGFALLMNQLARGAVETVQTIKEARSDVVMVHVEATGLMVTDDASLEPWIAHEDALRFLYFDWITGRVDGSHVLSAWLLQQGVTEKDLDWFQSHAMEVDVMGLNYYPDLSVQQVKSDGKEVVGTGVWGGTWALEQLFHRYYERYGRSLWLTETSTNGSVAQRLHWLEQSTKAIKKWKQSLPIIGYTWWPLFDLVNWDYREGTEPVDSYMEPMGLWSLKRQGEAWQRIPTSAADAYRQLIQEMKGR
jgi:beta-glucosidase